jgi:hypothetical protein
MGMFVSYKSMSIVSQRKLYLSIPTMSSHHVISLGTTLDLRSSAAEGAAGTFPHSSWLLIHYDWPQHVPGETFTTGLTNQASRYVVSRYPDLNKTNQLS